MGRFRKKGERGVGGRASSRRAGCRRSVFLRAAMRFGDAVWRRFGRGCPIRRRCLHERTAVRRRRCAQGDRMRRVARGCPVRGSVGEGLGRAARLVATVPARVQAVRGRQFARGLSDTAAVPARTDRPSAGCCNGARVRRAQYPHATADVSAADRGPLPPRALRYGRLPVRRAERISRGGKPPPPPPTTRPRRAFRAAAGRACRPPTSAASRGRRPSWPCRPRSPCPCIRSS